MRLDRQETAALKALLRFLLGFGDWEDSSLDEGRLTRRQQLQLLADVRRLCELTDPLLHVLKDVTPE